MDRIIEVKVGGNYIRKDKKTAGVRGEYEVAVLRIEFDESWDEYAKSITFWDARGLRPVFRELDAKKLENHAQSKRVFLVPIPEEPMAVAGEMTFVIDGIAEGKKQRSVSDKLEVKDAPMSGDTKPPVEPTPNDVEQMRLELGRINDSILEAVEAKEDILNMTVYSETLETGEAAFVIKSEADGVVHLRFGLPKGNTGDSGVYIGDTEPTEQVKNVWINPSASKLILMIRNEQGEWVEIPAITGKSAYEIAVEYGFVGTEAEWNDAVNLNRIAAENAFNGAENAKSRAEVYSEQTYQYYLQAEDSADKAEDANNKAESAAQSAANDADDALRYRNESETQKEQAREYALASGESATFAHDFAEQAKASADKAEQHANEFSGDIQRIEAGLSLRPTTFQVKAMHEEDLAENYNIRKIPEGKTIDDLYLEEDYGLYMIDDECPFADMGFTSRGSQLIVTGGYYWLEGFGDKTTTCQVLLCHDGFKYVIKQRSLQNGKWSAWEDQFATKDDVSKLTYLKDFFKDRPQGLNVDDLDNLTYENTGGGVFLWGEPQDGAKQNDIVFVTQGFSPRRREFLVTFQMRISLTPLAYAEFDSYNIKQRYQTFSHPTVQEPDGWSEWEDIYTTFKKVPYGKSIDDLYGEKHFGYYMRPYKPFYEIPNANEDFNFLIVAAGYYIGEDGQDILTNYQTRFVWDGLNYRIETRKGGGGYWDKWQDVFATPQYVNDQIAQIPTGGGGETWEMLQSKEISETDGELSQIVITLPAEYKEFVITVERTVPTSSSNTIIYPQAISYDNKSIDFPTSFWDSYEGGKASYFELRLSSMMLAKNNALKMDGFIYESNQTPKGKLKTIKTSGWIDGAIRWDVLRIVSKLNVGSIYKVWGCK